MFLDQMIDLNSCIHQLSVNSVVSRCFLFMYILNRVLVSVYGLTAHH